MRKAYNSQESHTLYKFQKIQNGNGINALLAKIVIQAFKDLHFFIKSPVIARKEFKKCSTNPHQLIKFWDCYAKDILVYLIGKNKASLMIKKIEPFLEKAKKIYRLQKIKKQMQKLPLYIITICFLLTIPIITSSNQDIYYTHKAYDINQCFISAGSMYNIHPNILWAIAKVESNFNPYAINRNSNGSYDLGIMQINSSWLPVLKRHGLHDQKQIWDPCYNIHVGAWVLSQCIEKHGYTWQAVGCYNAITPAKQVRYMKKVWNTFKTATN